MRKPDPLASSTPARLGAAAALLCLVLSACHTTTHGTTRAPATARSASSITPRVWVEHTPDGDRLMRHGEPYFVRGAGGDTRLAQLAALGANSIRTWGAEQLEPRTWPDGRVQSLPDRAAELGLTICAGYWVEHPSGHFDPNDPAAVQAEIDKATAFVRRWKNHPAILMWGVGNEVGFDAATFVRLDRIAQALKAEDPSRPTMTATAGIWPNLGTLFNEHCPHIDLLGVNAYGGLNAVPQELLRQGYAGPYIVTEFGPVGHWETGMTPWQAPIEQTSSDKACSYRVAYRAAVAGQPDRCVGAYAFLWGSKQERTGTWYGMVLDTGEKLASADAMAKLWTGAWPANRAPTIEPIDSSLAIARVMPGTQHPVSVRAADPEHDPLTYRWVVRREATDLNTGGGHEDPPEIVPGHIDDPTSASPTITTPTEPGAYRLFVTVYDGEGSAATANTPFLVIDPVASDTD